MARWYVQRNAKQAGPFEFTQLKKFASEGKIKADDLLRREDQSSWVKASDVKEVFAAAISQTEKSTGLTSPQATNPATPPPLPPKKTDLPISDEQIILTKTLLIGLVASLVIKSLLSPWMYDEEGNVMPLSLTTISTLFLTAVACIADTSLLFMSWRILPTGKRPFGLSPEAIVGMTFIPIFGYAANFLAYGMLGTSWWKAGTEAQPALADHKPLQSLRWMGKLLAGWLGILWIMFWLTEGTNFADYDMSWWYTPMADGKRRANFLERWLSPESLATLLLAAWYWSFHLSQIFIWSKLLGKKDLILDKYPSSEAHESRYRKRMKEVLFMGKAFLAFLVLLNIYSFFYPSESEKTSTKTNVHSQGSDSIGDAREITPSINKHSLAEGSVNINDFLAQIKKYEYFALSSPSEGMSIEGSGFEFIKAFTSGNLKLHLGVTEGFSNKGRVSALIAFNEKNTVSVVVAESIFDVNKGNAPENRLDPMFSFIREILPEAETRKMFSDNALQLLNGRSIEATHGHATLSLAYDQGRKKVRIVVVDDGKK